MKKLTKIWGVSLVVILLASLCVMVAPVSAADPLEWATEVIPSGSSARVVNGAQTYDWAIAGDDTTILAVGDVSGTAKVWKSTDAGRTWTDITSNTGISTLTTVNHVAIAPDEPKIVVISDLTNGAIVSTNGGTSFSTLGDVGSYAIKDVAIAPEVSPSTRYILVAGNDTATNNASLRYFELGTASPSWKNAVNGTGWTALTLSGSDTFWSVQPSPNFTADYTVVALCEATGTGGTLKEHVLSFNLKKGTTTRAIPATR